MGMNMRNANGAKHNPNSKDSGGPPVTPTPPIVGKKGEENLKRSSLMESEREGGKAGFKSRSENWKDYGIGPSPYHLGWGDSGTEKYLY